MILLDDFVEILGLTNFNVRLIVSIVGFNGCWFAPLLSIVIFSGNPRKPMAFFNKRSATFQSRFFVSRKSMACPALYTARYRQVQRNLILQYGSSILQFPPIGACKTFRHRCEQRLCGDTVTLSSGIRRAQFSPPCTKIMGANRSPHMNKTRMNKNATLIRIVLATTAILEQGPCEV